MLYSDFQFSSRVLFSWPPALSYPRPPGRVKCEIVPAPPLPPFIPRLLRLPRPAPLPRVASSGHLAQYLVPPCACSVRAVRVQCVQCACSVRAVRALRVQTLMAVSVTG